MTIEERAKLPKTGGVKRFACKSWNFDFENSNNLELFHVPNRNTLEEILLKEAEKLCLQNSFLNRVVYDHEEQSPFHSKLIKPESKKVEYPFYIPENEKDVTLIFESRFESGNLKKAIKM